MSPEAKLDQIEKELQYLRRAKPYRSTSRRTILVDLRNIRRLFPHLGPRITDILNGKTAVVVPQGPALIDIIFPTFTGTLTNTGGVWTTVAGNLSWDDHKGVSNLKLPAGQDGYIQMAVPSGDAAGAMLAFSTSPVNGGFGGYEAAMFVVPVGAKPMAWIDQGGYGTNNTILTPGPNAFMKLVRTGSQLKMQYTTNGTDWTDDRVYAFASAAELFIKININDGENGSFQVGKLYHPKGLDLVAV